MKEETFDAVVSLETIEHLMDPGGFATELARILRPNGRLLLSTPNAEGGLDPNPYHLKEFTLDQLLTLLEGARFRILQVRGQHWRLSSKVCQTVRGVRRLAWELERRPDVLSKLIASSVPRYWCVEASK
jgi:2-polyprenyl-3-methyl-5-hydroxy-6-metoxy-1,4-benzoquinol methylase